MHLVLAESILFHSQKQLYKENTLHFSSNINNVAVWGSLVPLSFFFLSFSSELNHTSLKILTFLMKTIFSGIFPPPRVHDLLKCLHNL